jgi:hypothetical protein
LRLATPSCTRRPARQRPRWRTTPQPRVVGTDLSRGACRPSASPTPASCSAPQPSTAPAANSWPKPRLRSQQKKLDLRGSPPRTRRTVRKCLNQTLAPTPEDQWVRSITAQAG